MRFFLSTALPPYDRVLLIESGSRELFEDLLAGLYRKHPNMQADLVTCYAGVPQHFKSDHGKVYRIHNYPDARARRAFYSELAGNRYNMIIMICAAQPIMTKWKWMLVARVRKKVLILNENGDYFYFDRGNLSTIREFVLFRAGMSGAVAVRTLSRLIAFPFALLYLILFAAAVHLRRKLRTL
ncbi:MAG: hypothetical protein ABSH09_35385 [Bryobacteraceae bacterium]|jgi:hypothetical protein